MRIPVLILLSSLAAMAQPVVTAITSAADYSDAVATGLPRGGIFSIFGLELASSAMPAPSPPLDTVLNGVRIRLWDSVASGKLVAECPLY